jgi:Zn-dependent protease with chaperone function
VNEDKASRYHRLGRRTALISSLSTFVILLGLVLTGASVALRGRSASAIGQHPSAIVSMYVLVLFGIVELATLPFAYYKGFVLERRYGLSTDTPARWLREHFKAACVSLLIGEAGAIFVYDALRRWPDTWWIAAGFGYTMIMIVMVQAAPVVLLPLFYRFRPLDRNGLRERLTVLARKAGTAVMGVYEWTLSDRTKKANAALTGIGQTRRILVSDTLLAEYSEEEIEVILAHELGHHVHHDIATAILMDGLVTLTIFYAAHRLLDATSPVLRLQSPADPAGIPLLLLTGSTLALLVRPVLNAWSRAHERRADWFALELTGNPAAFVSAIRRLGQQNLAEDNPSKLVQAFFYSHPPIKERLHAAHRWAATTT